MGSVYRNTLDEITRIQRGPPPVVAMPFVDDTMLTRPWVNDPIHGDVAPMEHHVVAPTLRGDGWSEVRFGAKAIRNPSVTGRVTVAPRGFGGRFDCDGRPLASNIFVSRARLQRTADALGMSRSPELVPRLNFDDPKLFAILALLAAEAEDCGPHSRVFLETLLDLLCVQLLRDHAAFPVPPQGDGQSLHPAEVRRITDYMIGHLDEAISLQQLADLLGLSRFHFCTAFRKAAGVAPHHWLVQLRIKEARRLLADPQLSITDIALAVGYQTPSAFAQAFRHAVGTTPTAFRNQVRY